MSTTPENAGDRAPDWKILAREYGLDETTAKKCEQTQIFAVQPSEDASGQPAPSQADAVNDTLADRGSDESAAPASVTDTLDLKTIDADLTALDSYLGDRMGAPSKTRQFGAYRRALRALVREVLRLRATTNQPDNTQPEIEAPR